MKLSKYKYNLSTLETVAWVLLNLATFFSLEIIKLVIKKALLEAESVKEATVE